MAARSRISRSAYLLLIALVGLLASGCGYLREDEDHPLTTLAPKGPQAQKIDDLVTPVFLVAGIVFVLVNAAIILIMIKFRRRPEDEDGVDEPVQVHGNNKLEWTWTLGPLVLLAILAVFNVVTIWDLEDRDPDALKVEVIGQQWWWEFRYDVNEDGTPDIITANEMVIPAGRQVDLTIRSNDVIHSFWIPALNGKKDAVPGRSHNWSLEADEPGTFQGTCTEFCGLSHALMRMEVRAVTPAEYDTWVENQMTPKTEADIPAEGTLEREGFDQFFANCASCHQINGFDNTGAITGVGVDGDYRGEDHPLTAANAPNLTHLMTRERYAGNLFDMYVGEIEDGVVDEGLLGSWLRDPDALKPNMAEGNRGMPNLNLSEEQITALVAYLTTLN